MNYDKTIVIWKWYENWVLFFNRAVKWADQSGSSFACLVEFTHVVMSQAVSSFLWAYWISSRLVYYAPHKIPIIRSLGPGPFKYNWWYIDLLTIYTIFIVIICVGVGTVHSQIDGTRPQACGVCTSVCAGQVMFVISIIMPQTAEGSTWNLQTVITASTTHWPNVGSMFGLRRRWWANIV